MQQQIEDAVRHTRQHHAIEHATIHVLSHNHPDRSFMGLSDPYGFTVYGQFDDHDLRSAVGDAMVRLQGGERSLSIHPNCGTNLMTTAIAAALAGMLARLVVRKGWLERIAATILLTLGAVVASKPLGFRVQRYTTLADVDDRTVQDIRLIEMGDSQLLRVSFE